MGQLTARGVQALRTKGRHADGAGLYLFVRENGTRSWVLRATIGGKRCDLGLGRYPDISLSQARKRCTETRQAVAEGINPLRERDTPKTPTFRDATAAVLELNRPRWRSPKHASNWIQMMERHAIPKLGSIPIDKIDRADVLATLVPIWTTRPETARRIRQRLRAVFAWSMAHGHRTDNPAGEVIDAALPAQPAVKEHFRALPYQEVSEALAVVDGSTAGIAARLCFRWLVLTAARSGEARSAMWEDIDLEARTQTIPAERMKAGRTHRVPLSDAALAVLQQARELVDDSGLIFPSPAHAGRMLSDMTLTKILRTTGLASRATVHGFRSSFRDWTLEQTATPWAVAEAALAHNLGGPVEQAYARSDLLERRRELMAAWGQYLESKTPLLPPAPPGV